MSAMTTPVATTDDSTEDGFFSVLYDITKKHPVIFIALFMLPLIALLVSLGMKWHYVFTDTAHYLRNFTMDSTGVWSDKNPYFSPGIDRYVRELDIAGLAGGVVGIFVGLYITVTTEKLNRQKERLNQQEMDRIKTQTSLLVQATESLNTLMIDVSGKVNEKVQLMEGTGEVLVGITKVIESVRSQGNNLLVLSNTARIEGVSQYRMEYVARHANLKPHELKNATQFDYARKAEALQRDCTDVENKLKEVSIYLRNLGADARVQFVTLNDQAQAMVAHPFLKYLGKVFNEHVVVETYRPGSNAVLNAMEGVAHHKRFLVPALNGEIPNPQEFLVQRLYEQQGQAIREMQELGIRVTKLAKTLPVQLFISAPIENKPGIYKGLCVCILGSGSSTSDRGTKLTAFLTDDPHIVASMTELFFDYETDAQMATREFMRPVLT
jgi:ribosomal protein L30E